SRFSCPLGLRSLHSFPTRRSSDLCVVITGAGRAFSAGEDLKSRQEGGERSFIASLRERYNPLILRLRTMEKPVIAAVNGVAAGRSEEHTSELQSRENLVCRLLLEK